MIDSRPGKHGAWFIELPVITPAPPRALILTEGSFHTREGKRNNHFFVKAAPAAA